MFSKLNIREATPFDAQKLAPQLRAADVAEIYATSGNEPLAALLLPFMNKRALTYSIIDPSCSVLGMFGVSPRTSDPSIGVPWLLGSAELVAGHKIQFMRECRTWIDQLASNYKCLENHVYTGNELHIKWIKWAGFEVVEYVPNYGARCQPFWRFRLELERESS